MDRISMFSPDTLWAMLPSALESALRACDGERVEDAFTDADQNPLAATFEAAHPMAEDLPGTYVGRRVGNVAILPVYGVIRPRPMFSFFSLFSMSTNLATLTHDLMAAVNNDAIDHIVLDVDSPGGMVTGTQEFAELLYQARAEKPISAYVQGMGASAAYWISSAADEIVINATGEVGSIGVVATFIDFKEMDKRIGIKEIEIVNTESPMKRADPDTKEGRAAIVARLNDMADVFYESIARNRGVEKSTVINDFGRGDLAVGARAVEMGLADRVSTFDEFLEGLVSPTSATGDNPMLNRNPKQPTAGATAGQEVEINTTQDLAAAYPSLCEEIAKTSYAEGEKAGKEAGEKEGREAGAAEERQRIQAIEELSYPGLESYINEAKFDPEATADSVAVESMRRLRAGEVDQSAIRSTDEETPAADVSGDLSDDAELEEVAKSAAAAANARRGR